MSNYMVKCAKYFCTQPLDSLQDKIQTYKETLNEDKLR